jgi:hypothetical protein
MEPQIGASFWWCGITLTPRLRFLLRELMLYDSDVLTAKKLIKLTSTQTVFCYFTHLNYQLFKAYRIGGKKYIHPLCHLAFNWKIGSEPWPERHELITSPGAVAHQIDEGLQYLNFCANLLSLVGYTSIDDIMERQSERESKGGIWNIPCVVSSADISYQLLINFLFFSSNFNLPQMTRVVLIKLTLGRRRLPVYPSSCNAISCFNIQ